MTVPAITTWSDVQAAIVTAVIEASGFPEEHVLWKYLNTNQPKSPFIDLSLSGSENPGQDGVVSTYDAAAPPGKEILLEVIGSREVNLQIEVWTDSTVTDDDEGADALAVAEKMRSAFVLPGLSDRLARARVSFLDLSGPVNYFPPIVRAGFRGRASYDVRVMLPAVPAREYTTWIEHVRGVVTALSPPAPPVVRPYED